MCCVCRSAEEGRNDTKYLVAQGGDKERLLCEVIRWRVHASNSRKHLEFWRAGIQIQRINRQKFHYKRSRYFTMVDSESSEEHWMSIDEYEDREAFDRLYKAAEDQPDLLYSDDKAKAAQMRKEKRSLTLDSKKELWTEHSELAVE